MSNLTRTLMEQATGGQWLLQSASPRRIVGVEVDSRLELSNRVFVAIRGERHDGHRFAQEAAERGAAVIIVEKSMEGILNAGADVLLVSDTRQALGLLARAYRRTLADHVQVVAVTGTVGKTTTKALLHSILSRQGTCHAAPKSFNNDIGVPLTLLNVLPEHSYVVVEIGTNAPGEISHLAAIVEPDVGVITRIGHGHLQGLGTIESVTREKLSLLRHVRAGGRAIVPDDVVLPSEFVEKKLRVIRFGDRDGTEYRLRSRRNESRGQTISLAEGSTYSLLLEGLHNARNALAAIGAARELGVDEEHIRDGLASVQSLDMRFERSLINGIVVINDAYNANPESMHASIETFMETTPRASNRVMILGDMKELGAQSLEFHKALGRQLCDLLERGRIESCLLIGRHMLYAKSQIERGGLGAAVELRSRVCGAAERWVQQHVSTADAVLLKGSRSMGLERLLPSIEAAGERRKSSKSIVKA